MAKSKLQKRNEAAEREEFYATEEGQKKRADREVLHEGRGKKPCPTVSENQEVVVTT